jgi:hypothetical protein
MRAVALLALALALLGCDDRVRLKIKVRTVDAGAQGADPPGEVRP